MSPNARRSESTVDFALDVPGEVGRLRRHLADEIMDARHQAVVDRQLPARERGEDPLVGLARQLPDARLAERRPRPRRRFAKQVVEAGPRHEQQPVRRTRARHGEPAERRVELVEPRRAGERVERDGDPVRLPLPAVDRRREQVVLGQSVLLAQPVDRVGGVVDRLVARRQDRDERVAAGVARRLLAAASRSARRRRRTYAETSVKPAANRSSSSASTNSTSGRSMSAASARRQPVDLEERRHARPDLRPDRRRRRGGIAPSFA